MDKKHTVQRIGICWLQSEGLSRALHERINDSDARSFYDNDERLLDLQQKAQGLAEALAEIRVLRRYV